jgi:anti-sigma factor RsiW
MCPDRELLSAWTDGEVPSPWRETIERHLETCESCSQVVASMNKTHALFSSDAALIDASSEHSRVRVEERLGFAAFHGSAPSGAFWARRYPVPFPVAAAAALVLAVLGFALAESGRRNADLRMAVQRAFEATPVATSGMGIESIIEYISKQNSAVNINITLPAEAFGAVTGDPFIVREADFQPGSRQ